MEKMFLFEQVTNGFRYSKFTFEFSSPVTSPRCLSARCFLWAHRTASQITPLIAGWYASPVHETILKPVSNISWFVGRWQKTTLSVHCEQIYENFKIFSGKQWSCWHESWSLIFTPTYGSENQLPKPSHVSPPQHAGSSLEHGLWGPCPTILERKEQEEGRTGENLPPITRERNKKQTWMDSLAGLKYVSKLKTPYHTMSCSS